MRDANSGNCVICPSGTYSDTTDATSCIPCPEGKNTRYEGTSNANLCFGNTQGRIQNSPLEGRGPTILPKFSKKLYEIEKILGRRGAPP